ncbi:glycosyltransferase [Xenococcus sp. PCC 7305]|uniref:glycosyltransferase n=1 Tax=Xenococcus sp. PCC 7305 TaxID=102125 RepID=UPI0002AC53C2|nr:glycosyltransferase [Xenococcus sp. PCC 7305]ELS03137.1 glycosyltransferase [Xenococcus sp. PCC 7305]
MNSPEDLLLQKLKAELESKRSDWRGGKKPRQLQLNSEDKQLLINSQDSAKEQQQMEKEPGRDFTDFLSAQLLSTKKAPSLKYSVSQEYASFADDIGNALFPPKKLNICIIAQDIFGPVRNGGIGTAFYYAANFLRDCGHQVSILYSLGNYCETGEIQDWVDYYAQRNINFILVPEPKIPSAPGALCGSMLVARKVYEYLRTQSFDLIHVSEWRGNAFYCLLAKKLGLAFANTTFCVKTSSPSLWSAMGNNHLVDTPHSLLRSYIERKSVEWADLVISPSQHMLQWMASKGYELPQERCYVQPNIMPLSEDVLKQNFQLQGRLNQVQELVFFGRLVPRKGIKIFCQALTQLSQAGEVNCKVVFMGKLSAGKFDAGAYIREQAKNWSFEWTMINDYDALQALDYLKSNNRLAIVPSLLDNSPFTLYECLSERIPFICSDRGGTPELVHPEDRGEVVFPIHPRKLAHKLSKILQEGVIIARPSFDFKQNLELWERWHLAIAENPQLRLEKAGLLDQVPTNQKLAIAERRPLVSVCLAHFNRPQKLSQAIASIKNQTYDNYEVILVDDESDQPEAIAYLDSLESEFSDLGWQIIRQENLYLGAVRNTSVRHAKGEYILFMDDDNCAKPHEIETFVRAALYSDADILTCFADRFEGDEPPQPKNITGRVTPVGDCVGYGLVENCYGDSNSLVKRSFLDKIGGFSEDYGVGKDDLEFFSRAILQGGKLLVVPEALYWYRMSKNRLRDLHFDTKEGYWRALRPYLENLPYASHDIVRLLVGLCDKDRHNNEVIISLKDRLRMLEHDFNTMEKLLSKQKDLK